MSEVDHTAGYLRQLIERVHVLEHDFKEDKPLGKSLLETVLEADRAEHFLNGEVWLEAGPEDEEECEGDNCPIPTE